MRKVAKFLLMLLSCISFSANAAEKTPTEEQSTRRDAVIFKVHDVNPVFEEGMVTGCDFTVTLYNRTAINFRSFSINMLWNDAIEENFHFNKYMETFITPEEMAAQRGLLEKEAPVQPVKVAINVNAFGADKQISIRSHVDTEKCYLLLQPAEYSVAPCDIARNIDAGSSQGLENNTCSDLFQLVSVSNPEYFGKFKKMTATEIANQQQAVDSQYLSDIDVVISKIVENLGTSNDTLNSIN